VPLWIISAAAPVVNPTSLLTPLLQALKRQQTCLGSCFNYNRAGVEILLNCVWLLLGLSLVAAWSARAWRTGTHKADGLLPSRRLQFTAVLMLVILLLPVISLTDDIAMCTTPRDAERALRLHDPFDGSQSTPAFLPSSMAWMNTLAVLLHTGPRRPVEQDANLVIQLAGTRSPIDSRPPPVTL
jgi:hypothetical protein